MRPLARKGPGARTACSSGHRHARPAPCPRPALPGHCHPERGRRREVRRSGTRLDRPCAAQLPTPPTLGGQCPGSAGLGHGAGLARRCPIEQAAPAPDRSRARGRDARLLVRQPRPAHAAGRCVAARARAGRRMICPAGAHDARRCRAPMPDRLPGRARRTSRRPQPPRDAQTALSRKKGVASTTIDNRTPAVARREDEIDTSPV